MSVTRELMYAVKEVLVDMAIDCTLPEDIGSLEIEGVFDLAEAKLKGNEEYQDMILGNKLGNFVSMDLNEALEIWKGLSSENDNDMADDHFTMWEPVQYSLTIKQLAEQL